MNRKQAFLFRFLFIPTPVQILQILLKTADESESHFLRSRNLHNSSQNWNTHLNCLCLSSDSRPSHSFLGRQEMPSECFGLSSRSSPESLPEANKKQNILVSQLNSWFTDWRRQTSAIQQRLACSFFHCFILVHPTVIPDIKSIFYRTLVRSIFLGQNRDPYNRDEKDKIDLLGAPFLGLDAPVVTPSSSLSFCSFLFFSSVPALLSSSWPLQSSCDQIQMISTELMGSLKLGKVWVFVQLIHMPMWIKNQLYKNLNIA